MKIFRNGWRNKGETLVEVLVSVVVLTTVLTSAFMVLTRAVKANVDVKNRVIAINIAREGVEAVRNIRDTNWLRFSGDRRNKWLCVDKSDDCEKMQTGFYTIEYRDHDGDDSTPEQFVLMDIPSAEELDLKVDNLDSFKDFRLYIDNKTGRFTYEAKDADGNDNIVTPFFRQIHLELVDVQAPTGNANKKLVVISRVGWLEEGQYKKVVLETHLYDFYERNSY